jgi:hypothetical protein
VEPDLRICASSPCAYTLAVLHVAGAHAGEARSVLAMVTLLAGTPRLSAAPHRYRRQHSDIFASSWKRRCTAAATSETEPRWRRGAHRLVSGYTS